MEIRLIDKSEIVSNAVLMSKRSKAAKSEEKLAKFIADVLELMVLMDPPKINAKMFPRDVRENYLNLNLFDGADAFFADEVCPDVDKPIIPLFIPSNLSLLDLPVAVAVSGEDEDLGENYICLLRINKEDLSKWRGKLSRILPTIFSVSKLLIETRSGYSEATFALFGKLGSDLVRVDREKTTISGRGGKGGHVVFYIRETGHHFGAKKEGIKAAVGWSIVRRIFWRVYLKISEAPIGITFCTDATGVKELFKLRTKPVGRKRRLPLLHWVQGHFRRLRYDPEVEVWVRQHFRGNMEFSWFGIEGRVIPSKVIAEQVLEEFGEGATEKIIEVMEKYANTPNTP